MAYGQSSHSNDQHLVQQGFQYSESHGGSPSVMSDSATGGYSRSADAIQNGAGAYGASHAHPAATPLNNMSADGSGSFRQDTSSMDTSSSGYYAQGPLHQYNNSTVPNPSQQHSNPGGTFPYTAGSAPSTNHSDQVRERL